MKIKVKKKTEMPLFRHLTNLSPFYPVLWVHPGLGLGLGPVSLTGTSTVSFTLGKFHFVIKADLTTPHAILNL